ncbi:MAG: GWxTD domain-containing protein [candidate division Zixibacteria bacterium]|nr:GWxTD domain-containing protein [candidate division Zixibacteria bacterium]
MKSVTSGSLIAVLFCLLANSPIWAQTDFGIEGEFQDPYFFVDYAGFREDAGEKYQVEIYYKIYNPKLTFIKQEGGFLASYELDLTILHKDGEQVTAKSIEKNYSVDSYDNSVSPDKYLVGLSVFSLYSGDYILVAKLIDRNSQRTTTIKRSFTLASRLEKGPAISDIELCMSANPLSSTGQLVKLDKELIPVVSDVFGENDSTMFAYFEVYPDTRGTREYVLTCEITGIKQSVLKEQESVEIKGKKLAQIKQFDMQKLSAGDYVLNVRLYSKDKKLLTESSKNFRVEWSPLSLLKKDYHKAIQQLKYIADKDEMNKLEKANLSEQEELWEEFWKSKDPTQNTEKNEMKDEYYKRLNYANANFGIHNKEGWATDMGMVYITYGRPDEIEKHYFDRESDREEGEYMIWYYYRLRPERKFFFRDSGYGEYQLQYPYDGVQRY